MRVLHIVDSLGVGGAETWLIQLLRHWAANPSMQIDLLLTSGNRAVFDDEAQSLGARLHYLRYGRRDLIGFIASYRKLLKREGYTAIHDHQDYTSGWRWLLGRGTTPPVRVTHVHNPVMHYHANYSVSRLRMWTALVGKHLVRQCASHVCGTSLQLLREYGFQPGTTNGPPVSAVHCGFKVEQFSGEREPDRAAIRAELGWPDIAQVILFAGRLDRAMAFDHPQNHKNSWLALHVARAAAQRDPNVHFIMAGAGDEQRQELEAVVADWGLADRFKLVGVHHDIPHLMRGSDLLLFPSRQEGLGMVAVEAQAAGLPVLASTAVPQECVVLPDLCRFSPLTDTPDQWALQALNLMKQPKPKPEHCAEAIRASAFSIENSAAALETIYRGGVK